MTHLSPRLAGVEYLQLQHLILTLLTCGPMDAALPNANPAKRPRARSARHSHSERGIRRLDAPLHTLRPTPWLPPWKDPEILNFGLLFLFASTGMILGAISGGWGKGPPWLVAIMEIGSCRCFCSALWRASPSKAHSHAMLFPAHALELSRTQPLSVCPLKTGP